MLAEMSIMWDTETMEYEIAITEEYLEWLLKQPQKAQGQIEKRLAMIRLDGFFGLCKDLDDGVWELKWIDGRRVYYAYIPKEKILLLLGGNKNGHDKDIKKAKKIFKEKACLYVKT